MTSRRSFLRGLLALPAVSAVPAVVPPLGAIPEPPELGVCALSEPCDFAVDGQAGEIHMHGKVYINGRELSQYVWDQWLAKQSTLDIRL